MKYAISVQTNDPKTIMDRRFGRCPYFYIYDSEAKSGEFKANPGADLDHGAGRQAAQFVANESVAQIVTGEVGPKSAEILDKVGIPYIQRPGEDALDRILSEIQ